jgi:hypothetical protein
MFFVNMEGSLSFEFHIKAPVSIMPTAEGY